MTSQALQQTARGVDPFDVSWRERVVVLGGVGLAVLLVIGLGTIYARESTVELVGLVPMTQLAVGKFLPLWGISGESNFGPYELGLVIWVMDTLNVVVLVYALEGLYRIRPLKRALTRIQANAGLVLTAYPAMRRAALVGVVLFVLFPVAGTGAVAATFMGVLLGMHRALLIGAVSFGGLMGGLLMAFAAVHFKGAVLGLQAMQRDPTIKYLFIAGTALVVIAIVWLANRAYKKALARAAELPPE